MATVIKNRNGTENRTERAEIPNGLAAILPPRLTDEILRMTNLGGRIEEIRLRRGRRASLSVEGRNVLLETVLGGADIEGVVSAACDGSLYAHRDAIAAGYLTLSDGIRIGVCGRAAVEEKKVIGVYDISGLNIRIPAKLRHLGAPICRLLRDMQGVKGVLVYAPPGGGKTTLLRSVAAQMASGSSPNRVAVIDTRGELGFSLEDPDLCLDVLTGYPRALGIEIATRTMNAQLIVCDEIGEVKEAEAIVSAQNCGVPFIASAHADSVQGLLRRTGIYRLHRAQIFGAYVGITRRAGGGEFHYTITSWEEADGILQDRRSTDPRL